MKRDVNGTVSRKPEDDLAAREHDAHLLKQLDQLPVQLLLSTLAGSLGSIIAAPVQCFCGLHLHPFAPSEATDMFPVRLPPKRGSSQPILRF